MKIYKDGGHRLFENDPETAKIVSEMLLDLEKNGMDAVRKYSKKFDDWDPDDFELKPSQIQEAIDKLDPQVKKDTEFCQSNVRKFAEAQMATLQPLETEIMEGVTLGHKHIPVNVVGQLHPRRHISHVWLRPNEHNSRQSGGRQNGQWLPRPRLRAKDIIPPR